MSNFSDWLTTTLANKGLIPADLARLMNKDQSVIGRFLSGERNPSPETIVVIARALEIRPETVFRKVVDIPDEPEYIPFLDDWNEVFYDLTDDERLDLLDNARAKIRRRKEGRSQPLKQSSRSRRPARNAVINK